MKIKQIEKEVVNYLNSRSLNDSYSENLKSTLFSFVEYIKMKKEVEQEIKKVNHAKELITIEYQGIYIDVEVELYSDSYEITGKILNRGDDISVLFELADWYEIYESLEEAIEEKKKGLEMDRQLLNMGLA